MSNDIPFLLLNVVESYQQALITSFFLNAPKPFISADYFVDLPKGGISPFVFVIY